MYLRSIHCQKKICEIKESVTFKQNNFVTCIRFKHINCATELEVGHILLHFIVLQKKILDKNCVWSPIRQRFFTYGHTDLH